MQKTGFLAPIAYCLLLTAYCLLPTPVLAGGQPWEMPKEEDSLRFRLTNTVFAHIKDYYIDFNNLVATEVLRDALRGIEDIAPNLKIDIHAGVAGSLPAEVLVQMGGSTKTFDTIGIKNWLVLRELLKDVLTFIESGGNCPVSTPELEYAALNGILNSFDPYTRLYRPEDLDRIKTLGSGSFVGLGMDVELKEGFLTVTYLHKDSPACKAGLQLGDRIIEIEGESTKNMGIAEALSRMSGPLDTSVTLSVWRWAVAQSSAKKQDHSRQGGGQILSFTLKRERIELEPAEWELLEEGLGYIKLKGFQEGAFYSMVKAIRGLEEVGGLRGLVLDLRNNYGGVMEEIINVAELFLPTGIITIKTRTNEVLPEFVTARPSGRAEEACPIVVLMDEGSASGAEILSAALKDNGRALLVGEKTFGKACIQQVFRLHGRYALKLTTAKYFTPRGEYINFKGLTPDILLVPIKLDVASASGGLPLKDKTTLSHLPHYAQAVGTGLKPAPTGDNGDGTTHRTPAVLCYLERARGEYASGGGVIPAGGLLKDFHIQLAKNLLKAFLRRAGPAPAHAGESMWSTALETVKEYREEEDRRIVRALESRKIDWSVEPIEGIPVSVASLTIDKGGDRTTPAEVEAGDTVTFTLFVENRGEYPLFRVLAKSASGNPTFDGLEFPIGKVEPGKKVSYSLKVKVPDYSLDRQDEIVLKFTEDNGFPPADIVSGVIIWAHPTPLFAYSCRLPWLQASKESEKGMAGETLPTKTELSLRVKNIGQGTSRQNVVVLKGDEETGMIVLNGRQELGVLKPGEEREVKIAFSFSRPGPPAADTSMVDTARVASASGGLLAKVKPPRILITDLFLGTQLSARLPLQGGGKAAPDEGGTGEIFCLPPSIILQNAVLSAMEGLVELSFTARDDHRLEGAFVMVNEHKVFFGHNSEPTPEHTFTAGLPITKGPNLVRIVAYDDQGLSTEKAFIITGR